MAKKQTADRAASASPKSAARRKGRQGSPAAPQRPPGIAGSAANPAADAAAAVSIGEQAEDKGSAAEARPVIVSPALDTVGQAQTADEPSGVNEDTGGSPQAGPVTLEPASTVTAQTARPNTKRAQLISCSSRPEGASVDDIGRRLGWLPYTVRAAITGLRHAGPRGEPQQGCERPIGVPGHAGRNCQPVTAMTTRQNARRKEALARLPKLDIAELRRWWRRLYKAEASPHLSRELLVRAVAYRMQELALGGLRPEPQRQLLGIAHEFKETGGVRMRARPDLKPGTRLIREWQGRAYKVLVLITASPGKTRATARFPPSPEKSPAPGRAAVLRTESEPVRHPPVLASTGSSRRADGEQQCRELTRAANAARSIQRPPLLRATRLTG